MSSTPDLSELVSRACTFYSFSIILNVSLTWSFLFSDYIVKARLSPKKPTVSTEEKAEEKKGIEKYPWESKDDLACVKTLSPTPEQEDFMKNQTWARPACKCADCL
jgi:hypothetical protein